MVLLRSWTVATCKETFKVSYSWQATSFGPHNSGSMTIRTVYEIQHQSVTHALSTVPVITKDMINCVITRNHKRPIPPL
jgi:hypothetical protein